jgi:capsular exopolysaccharide synthesis family protein
MVSFLRRINTRSIRKDTVDNALTKSMVTLLEPTSAASEAYRTVRTNLLYSSVDDPPRAILLTSSKEGEGKSTTSCNLGVVLAQAEKSTLILDCDFRKPSIHKFFDLQNFYGIVDVLAGARSPQEVWTEPLPGLKTITVGPIPPSPAELVGSQRLSEFLDSVRKEFDYVLVDASSIGLVSDPASLATQVDGTLLVIDGQATRMSELQRSIRSLEAVGAKILGTVLNKVQAPQQGYYNSYMYR